MVSPLRLLIFGRQGSGKGTQSSRLAAHYGIPHISTGDMLRAAVASGSDLGLQVQSIMSDGGLVSDELMEGVVRDRLGEDDAAAGFLLDGYPRTLGQAAYLEGLLAPAGVTLALNLDVDNDVVVDRITRRRVCESCGSTYALGEPAWNQVKCCTLFVLFEGVLVEHQRFVGATINKFKRNPVGR